MKFYKSGLEAVVWNPERQAPMATFEKPDFCFETDDPIVIKKLKELGYQVLPDLNAGSTSDSPQVSRLRS